MAMADDLVLKAASRLREAAETMVPCAPVRDLIAAGDVDAAYAVQMIGVRERMAAGWQVSGHKIGLTSPQVQAQLGVDQPDFGTLFAEVADGDRAEVPTAQLLAPRVEAEVAVVLDVDVTDTGLSRADIAAMVRSVVPALEVVDSRIAGWNITFVDTVADNASAGRYVLGGSPQPLGDLDLAAVEMEMTVDGVVVSRGVGADCLGHPLDALGWLAAALLAQGTPLRAGEVVLTGALGPMVPVVAGQQVEARISGLGSVSARFV
jgi:2-keto-4-pentenoate hydratase